MSRRHWLALACLALVLALDGYVLHLRGKVAEMRQITAELRDVSDRLHWRLVGMRSEHAEMDYQLTEMEADAVCSETPATRGEE